MSSPWSRTLARRTLCLLAAGGLTLGVAACGDGDNTAQTGGKVKITVTGQPPASQPFERSVFDADVQEFEAAHPNIDIDPHEGFMDPKTFSAKLAGGRLEDVYYVYFTDPANLAAKHQAADITRYLKDFPAAKQIKPTLNKVFTDSRGRVYGLPWTNYSMGLLYNRKLFTAAGLDPDKPPTTWAEVRADAQKIAALGNGTVGYGDYSKSNCTPSAAGSRSRTATAGRPTSTTTRAARSSSSCTTCAGPTTPWAAASSSSGPTCCR
jgi:multiple sugar transport system substrate-binding protein